MMKQYIFTERAHLMCPSMYFGIAEVIESSFDPANLHAVFDKLAIAHPFLRAVLGHEESTNQFFYKITDKSKIEIIFKDEEVTSINDQVLFSEYEKHTSRDWDLTKEGMLKVACWKVKDKTCVLFIFHHLLADGRAALGLALEMAKLYVRDGEIKSVSEHLISSIDDLPTGSKLPFTSKMLLKYCNRKWIKENNKVTYEEYHNFANRFMKADHVIHLVDLYEFNQYDSIISDCKENNISVNDYLLTKMFVEENTNKIIIAKDIRNELKCFNEGALGNYSTAFSIEYKPKSSDIFAEAKSIHSIVKKKSANKQKTMMILSCYTKMNSGLLDAAAISALGGYNSKIGDFVGGMMFGFKSREGYSITNLGKIETKDIDIAIFIPPASPAIRKMQGVLTVNGKMVVCSSERE